MLVIETITGVELATNNEYSRDGEASGAAEIAMDMLRMEGVEINGRQFGAMTAAVTRTGRVMVELSTGTIIIRRVRN